MKKLFALLVSVVLCLGCCVALGEDIDLTGIEVAPIEAKDIVNYDISFRNANMATQTAHVVTVTDNSVTVIADGIKLVFDIQKAGGGYFCFTQDMMASLASYIRVNDMDAVQQFLISENIYIDIVDEWTLNESFIYAMESDQLSTLLNDIAGQPASMVNIVADSLGGSVVKYNGRPWIYVTNSNNVIFVTIVNGQYVYVQAAGTLDDAGYIMNGLTVSPVR